MRFFAVASKIASRTHTNTRRPRRPSTGSPSPHAMPMPTTTSSTAASRGSLIPERNRMNAPRPTSPNARAMLSPMTTTKSAPAAAMSVWALRALERWLRRLADEPPPGPIGDGRPEQARERHAQKSCQRCGYVEMPTSPSAFWKSMAASESHSGREHDRLPIAILAQEVTLGKVRLSFLELELEPDADPLPETHVHPDRLFDDQVARRRRCRGRARRASRTALGSTPRAACRRSETR